MQATICRHIKTNGTRCQSPSLRIRRRIRIALGSSRLGVSRLVLADVLRLAGIDILVAIPCSVLLPSTQPLHCIRSNRYLKKERR